MRIAATYENGEVFQHFGHTAQFKLFDTENGKILFTQVVDTQGSGHGALAEFLRANGVEALICGGIGGGAQSALAEAGIKLYAGVRGSADAAVLALLAGKLNAAQGATCDIHHEDGHDCGSMEKALPAANMGVAGTAAEALSVQKRRLCPHQRHKASFYLRQLHKGHHICIPGGIAKEHL